MHAPNAKGGPPSTHPIDVPRRAELSVIQYQLIGKITKSEDKRK